MLEPWVPPLAAEGWASIAPDGWGTVAAWASFALAAISLMLSARHERLLRGRISVHAELDRDPETDEPVLKVWVTCHHRAVGLKDVRLYRGRPRSWKPGTLLQERRDEPPAFELVEGENPRVVGEKPVIFALPLADYRQYRRTTRRGKVKFATHVGVLVPGDHRYAGKVPTELRKPKDEDV